MGGRHYKVAGTPPHVTDAALREKARLEAELAAKVPKPKEELIFMPPGDKSRRREVIIRP